MTIYDRQSDGSLQPRKDKTNTKAMTQQNTIRIRLDGHDFEHLIRGGELQHIDGQADVRLILADIGSLLLMATIEQARLDGETRLAEVRQAGQSANP